MSSQSRPKRPKGRAVPPAEPANRRRSDNVVPEMSSAEAADWMATRRGKVTHIEHRHDADCPAVGHGRGCTCKPDVYLFTGDWQLVGKVVP